MKDGKIVSDQKEHGIYRLDGNNDGISRLPHPGYMRATSLLSPEESTTRHRSSIKINIERQEIDSTEKSNKDDITNHQPVENKSSKRKRLIQ